MKPALALLLLAVLATSAPAQESAPTDDPLVMQRRLAMVLRQSTKSYEAGDYQAALERLAALQGTGAQDLAALNLRGAIYTKLGRYDEARGIFASILSGDPNYFPAAFNLGEVQFVQGDYAGALESFEALRRRDPRNELLRFKVMLCQLLTGQEDAARRLAAGFIPAGSTPAWYYAQAILARQSGDEKTAKKHLTAARQIYPPAASQLFDESLELVDF
jgi:tetratricopeptide (TPR) repeat protein